MVPRVPRVRSCTTMLLWIRRTKLEGGGGRGRDCQPAATTDTPYTVRLTECETESIAAATPRVYECTLLTPIA